MILQSSRILPESSRRHGQTSRVVHPEALRYSNEVAGGGDCRMEQAGINLERVVPWGRSLDEYIRMFDLTESDLSSRILDCGGGPAGFNAEMHARGHNVVSCDPIYEFSGEEISRRIDATCQTVLK